MKVLSSLMAAFDNVCGPHSKTVDAENLDSKKTPCSCYCSLKPDLENPARTFFSLVLGLEFCLRAVNNVLPLLEASANGDIR